jgi:hypothetical protein
VTAAKLPSLPLLAPTAGLLAQFLGRWYGPNYRGTLNVIADVDSPMASTCSTPNSRTAACITSTNFPSDLKYSTSTEQNSKDLPTLCLCQRWTRITI